mgnify:CR=1 FL=1
MYIIETELKECDFGKMIMKNFPNLKEAKKGINEMFLSIVPPLEKDADEDDIEYHNALIEKAKKNAETFIKTKKFEDSDSKYWLKYKKG